MMRTASESCYYKSSALRSGGLIDTEKEKIHDARIKMFSARLDGKEVPEEILSMADRSSARYDVVEQIMEIE